jgi:glycosyltransferase involved in cell wall biosynthesis
MTTEAMKVLHIITGLNDGGAEAVLYRLITADTDNTHHVVSLMDQGVYGSRIVAAGVPVDSLGMRRGRLGLGALVKLARLVRAVDPDIVQTWMYHANLIGGVVARSAGKRGVVWGIHHTNLDPQKSPRTTRVIARLCGSLSGLLPQRIISCSEDAAGLHAALGYDKLKLVVVPNGYDLSVFAPDPCARTRLRAEWGIEPDATLFGMVARWDPQKDHQNIIAALARFGQTSAAAWRCVLVGTGMMEANEALSALLRRYGVQDRVRLLGQRNDIPAVMNALDIHVLSSGFGEAFPNVVAEAMACGTPCIVTDVGDAALMVGETGWVVPPSDAPQLADALGSGTVEMANKAAWQARQSASRERVGARFALDKMVESYRAVWREAAA